MGQSLYDLKNFGIHDENEVSAVGANAKMNEFCAAMGLCNLRHISEEIEKRRLVDERYRKHLGNVDGIRLNCIQEGLKRNYAYFPVLIDEKEMGVSRAEIYDKLKKNNIFPRKYFYPLTSSFSAFHRRYNVDSTPIALHVSNRILTLPIYADLELETVDRICDLILGT